MKKELISISASKLTQLEKCSWIYYCQNLLKLPQKGNSGSKRGNVCHSLLECLLNPKHKKHVSNIIKKGSIVGFPSIVRFVRKQMKKEGLTKIDNKNIDNFKLIDEMILVALKNDFYCKGGKIEKAEKLIDYTNEKGTYKIRGYIDKMADYGEYEVIFDYKTSEKVYEGEELSGNYQAYMYILWLLKSKNKKGRVRFIFLRHPDNPLLDVEVTREQLNGFEDILERQSQYIQDFTLDKALSNLAANQPYQDGFRGPTACGRGKVEGQLKKDGTLMWGCDFKWKFDYFALIDEDGNVLKTAFDQKELETKSGQAIIKKHYAGCPKFNGKREENNLI